MTNTQYWVTGMSVWGPNPSPGWFTLNGEPGGSGAGVRAWTLWFVAGDE